MTTNAFFMALAAGVFAVLCVVAWHLVLALKQVRRTTLSVETFLESTRPRVEVAADRLDAMIARADRILSTAEQGQGGFAAVINAIGQALAGWKRGSQFISTASAVLSGIMEAWNSARSAGEESAAGAQPAGGTNE